MLLDLNSTFMMSLIWPLAAIPLTKNYCKQIMAPAISHVLYKLKLVKKMKRKVIYSPLYLQGMGLTNIYTLMGSIHLATIVQFYDTNTDLGHLLQTSLECLMMELGIPKKTF